MTARKITPGRARRAIVRKTNMEKIVEGETSTGKTVVGRAMVGRGVAAKTIGAKTIGGKAVRGKAVAAKTIGSKTIKGKAAAGGKPARRKGGARWNGRRRDLFLAALTETANVRRSAKTAGMSLAAAYDLKRRDPAFAQAWKEALEIGYSEVEMALLRETLNGSEKVETLEEGEEKKLKYIKTVRSFNVSVAVRLFMAHREEVLAFRREREGIAAPETSTIEETEHYLDLIRARLDAGEDGGLTDYEIKSCGAAAVAGDGAAPAVAGGAEPAARVAEGEAGEAEHPLADEAAGCGSAGGKEETACGLAERGRESAAGAGCAEAGEGERPGVAAGAGRERNVHPDAAGCAARSEGAAAAPAGRGRAYGGLRAETAR